MEKHAFDSSQLPSLAKNAKKFQAKLEKILIQETQNNIRKSLTSKRIS